MSLGIIVMTVVRAHEKSLFSFFTFFTYLNLGLGGWQVSTPPGPRHVSWDHVDDGCACT